MLLFHNLWYYSASWWHITHYVTTGELWCSSAADSMSPTMSLLENRGALVPADSMSPTMFPTGEHMVL